jgi:Domain of unknown function (DUF4190)
MTEPSDTPGGPYGQAPYPGTAYPPPQPYPGTAYPPPPPQPYSGWNPPPPPPKNGLGTAALVIAIIGLVLCVTVIGGIVLGIVALVLGILAYGRVKRGEANNGGVAIAGIVLGALAVVAGAVFIWILVGLFSRMGFSSYWDCYTKATSDQARQQCADQFRQHVQTQFSVTLTPSP